MKQSSSTNQIEVKYIPAEPKVPRIIRVATYAWVLLDVILEVRKLSFSTLTRIMLFVEKYNILYQ